jgi:hypothetical protein
MPDQQQHPRRKVVPTHLFSFEERLFGVSLNQLQRLLARESPAAEVGKQLSQPRTFELVRRWVQADLAVYRRVYHGQSGWVHLTREGLRMVNLPFRADAPADAFLSHVYWVNEVRLSLEEEEPAMRWISERLIQAEQRRKHIGGKLGHVPDGVLLLPGPGCAWHAVTIEVQLSKPSVTEVRRAIADPTQSGWEDDPLRYYVSRKARGIVRRTYEQMLSGREVHRPWVEIIDLAAVHQ